MRIVFQSFAAAAPVPTANTAAAAAKRVRMCIFVSHRSLVAVDRPRLPDCAGERRPAEIKPVCREIAGGAKGALPAD
jgi:hypothetical protein